MPVRVRYSTLEIGDVDIHLRTLRDKQQFEEDPEAEALGISSAQWSFFGVVWDSGPALAHLMVDYDIEGKRILEVGCGIGVASLVLNQRGANVTATDQHPAADRYLLHNAALNDGPPIPFVRANWLEDVSAELGTFDLVIGSDLLYDRDQVVPLADFVQRCLAPDGELLLLDPRRGLFARFRKQLEAAGLTATSVELSPNTPEGYKGSALHFRR